ncbi:predicted protein [Naegleria gruberi]|uniref:Predicted protein n=1 Tax=Naegleria gruberi TaxID=5762 RepID=D2VQY3_NAEGR|nr:uncharacterized protein NAEGRDRAFT_51549 [Naegleria gruberi]EFC40793.1 predicted protein [Naegleria gruberi]|eukprot:XP_002673537.1 predicted protein [Naegleria gruberi strain NEG-M]
MVFKLCFTNSQPKSSKKSRMKTRVITLVTLLLSVLLLHSFAYSQSLVITVNRLTLFNGDNVTITSNELASTLNGSPSPARIVYNVLSITNGQFQVRVGTNQYTPVTQFSQDQINLGNVRFIHPGNLAVPSYTLNAFDPVLGVTSAASTATITFTAFSRNVIGAPRPVFEASVNPSTLNVTLRITMFKTGGVFSDNSTTGVFFNIGLSKQYTCLSNDLIRDGFVLVTSTAWYNVYQQVLTLNQFTSNPNVQWVSNGGVVDLVAVMFADYMIQTNIVSGGSSQKNCYETIFTQRYILTITLAVTRINFDQSSPNTFLKPKRIFVNDLNRLEIRLEVWTTITQNATSWFVTGPYAFTVTDAVFTGLSGGFMYYQIVMQSNVITAETNFGGDYSLSFRTNGGNTYSIAYTLQYLVPYPAIEEELVFSTSALSYANSAFTQVRTQFGPTDTIYIRVESPLAPSLATQSIIPYNVILCCYSNFATIPSNPDCRNASRTDATSDNIFVSGQAVRAGGVDADLLFSANTTYGFDFGFPLAIRDDTDRRCFLTIESSYSSRNNIRSALAVKDSIQSLTYRVFDYVASTTKKTNNGSIATVNYAMVAFVFFTILNFVL